MWCLKASHLIIFGVLAARSHTRLSTGELQCPFQVGNFCWDLQVSAQEGRPWSGPETEALGIGVQVRALHSIIVRFPERVRPQVVFLKGVLEVIYLNYFDE